MNFKKEEPKHEVNSLEVTALEKCVDEIAKFINKLVAMVAKVNLKQEQQQV